MILTSAVLIFGALAIFLWNIFASNGAGLPAGGEILLQSSIPWPFVTAFSLGALIGIAAMWRRPSKTLGVLVATELLVATFGLWFFFAESVLPEHSLSIAVGDRFPQYALLDQQAAMRRGPVTDPTTAKLYLFYRGDW